MRTLAIGVLAAVMAVGCGSETASTASSSSSSTTTASSTTACIPGEQRACACPGGAQGAQVCADDGLSLGACTCPGAGGAGQGGAAAGGGAPGGAGGATAAGGAGTGGATAAGGAGGAGGGSGGSGGAGGVGGAGGAACEPCATYLVTLDHDALCPDSVALADAVAACGCAAGVCDVACGATFCADPKLAPDAECGTCLQDKCMPDVMACADDL